MFLLLFERFYIYGANRAALSAHIKDRRYFHGQRGKCTKTAMYFILHGSHTPIFT